MLRPKLKPGWAELQKNLGSRMDLTDLTIRMTTFQWQLERLCTGTPRDVFPSARAPNLKEMQRTQRQKTSLTSLTKVVKDIKNDQKNTKKTSSLHLDVLTSLTKDIMKDVKHFSKDKCGPRLPLRSVVCTSHICLPGYNFVRSVNMKNIFSVILC